MAGFFNKLFSLFGSSKPDKTRRLTHPRDLRQGDFLKFQFLPQSEVSGKTFEVNKVNTYSYDGMHYPEMILKDREGTIIFMTIEEEDGEEHIGLSKKVPKSQIREIIPQDTLDRIFEKGTGESLRLRKENHPEGFENWLVEAYRESDEYKGNFAKGDARSNQARTGENFKSYLLTDSSDEYALEIEVYGENEIELSATVYHDINTIEEILPGSLEEKL